MDNNGGNSRFNSFGPNITTPGSFDFIGYSSNALVGTTRMFISSAGLVGIGTTSPAQELHVQASSGSGNIRVGGSAGLEINFDTSGFTTSQIKSLYSTTNAAAQLKLVSGFLTFHTGTSNLEKARIDADGRLLVGTSTDSGPVALVEVAVGGQNAAQFGRYTSSSTPAYVLLTKSRSDTKGAHTVVQNNDGMGALSFLGSDGTAFVEGARIEAQVDGTPGANDMPGRLVFSTTADGGSSPSERLRITSAGLVGIGTSAPSAKLHVSITGAANASTTDALILNNDNSNVADNLTTGISWMRTGNNGSYIYTRISSIRTGTHDTALAFSVNEGGTLSERLRLDSLGRLLVGTSDGSGGVSKLVVQGASNGSAVGVAQISYNGLSSAVLAADTDIGYLRFTDQGSNSGVFAQITASTDGTTGASDYPGRLVFSTTADGASSPTEAMRINNAGELLVGKTTNLASDNGTIIGGQYFSVASQGFQGTGFHRNGDDGGIIGFFQDGTEEGSISVSGGTVSYNGAHLSRWSQLASGAERIEILRGSVLSNLDEMCEWGEEENEQLNRMKVSDVEGDKNVSGVFQAWDDDDDTYTNDFYCAMTGDFIIRIAEGVTVERGDLLMSAGDGTAKPQDDDIIRSKTIAKVTSTNVSCTYEDGSYCVPCVLMAC
jgi:hypothetical protein